VIWDESIYFQLRQPSLANQQQLQTNPQRQQDSSQTSHAQFMQTLSSKAYQILMQQAAVKYGGNISAMPRRERAGEEGRLRRRRE